MDRKKLLSRLAERLGRYEAQPFPDGTEEFAQFLYRYGKTRRLLEKVYSAGALASDDRAHGEGYSSSNLKD
jgi:hypothetical protein